MNENITRLGIDLAKTIFQVCGANKHGKVVFNKKLKRDQLPSYIATIPTCEVVMEACATSSYWSQVFTRYGHTVKLINPAYVRPYVHKTA